jgi:hypothetical protein
VQASVWEHTLAVVRFLNGVLYSAEVVVGGKDGEEVLLLIGSWVPQLWGLLLLWLPAWAEAMAKVGARQSYPSLCITWYFV